VEDYNSHNTTRLSVPEVKKLLLKLDFIKDVLANRSEVRYDS